MIFSPYTPNGERKIRAFSLSPTFLDEFRGRQPKWGPVGYFTYKRTYSRKKPDGTFEEFWETVKRVVEGVYYIQKIHCVKHHLIWNEQKAQRSAQEMYRRMWDFKFLPPGRGLWMMGTEFVFNKGSACLNNCLSYETEIITSQGIKRIGECAGSVQKLLTRGGKWVDAPIRSFGKQRLMKITLMRQGITKVIHATPDHRWFAKDRRTAHRNKGNIEFTTQELRPNVHRLQYVFGQSVKNSVRPSVFGIAHGITFGDGTTKPGTRNANGLMLCGEKDRELARYFSESPQTEKPGVCEGGGIWVADLPNHFRETPSLSENKSYLYGWLAGYFAADGTMKEAGQAVLSSSKRSNLEFVRSVCSLLGIGTYGIRHETRTSNLTGEPHNQYFLCFMRDTLENGFFLLASHKERFLKNPSPTRRFWTVKSVEDTNRYEEVYCATVERERAFALADNILTGNCGFVTSEDINNDFAEPFCFLMDMSMLGVGVGGDTKGAGKVRLRRPKYTKTPFVVEDDREGWVTLIRTVLNSFVGKGHYPKIIDYSQVRPKGEPLKQFGGVASGPQPLMDLVENLTNLLTPKSSRRRSKSNNKITSSQIVDVFNYIGKCLPGDVWVLTAQGPRQIKHLIGKKVDLVVDGKSYPMESDGFFCTGEKQVYRLTTDQGWEVRLTADHRVKTLDRGWVEAQNLQEGEKVVLHEHKDFSWGGSGTDDQGYVLGLLVGDGYIRDTQWGELAQLFTWDQDKGSEQIRKVTAAIVDAMPHRSDWGGWRYNGGEGRQVMSSKSLTALAAEYGITKGNKTLTPQVEASSSSFAAGFLRGLFDADGSVNPNTRAITLSQSNRPLLLGVQRMLSRFGVLSAVYSAGRPTEFFLYIGGVDAEKYMQRVGFTNTRKTKLYKTNPWIRGPYKRDPVTVIKGLEPEGVEPVYDVTVTDVHAFDANGFWVHNCVVAGGIRRCLPAGTLVHTAKGLIPIEDVKAGMSVVTSKGYSNVTDWVRQGVQPISVITTQMGTFECTDKHKIAVISDVHGNYVWKQTRELEPGDRMVFVDHVVEGKPTSLPSYNYVRPERSTTCVDIQIPDLDSEMAWFLGLFHGDGYAHVTSGKGHVSIAIAEGQENILERARAQISRFGVNHNTIAPKDNDRCYKLRVSSKQLADYLCRFFKRAKESITIPGCVMHGIPKIRAAYVAGLFDADGSAKNRPLIAATSVYPDYLEQVQSVLASLGVPSRFRLHKDKTRTSKGWQPIFHLSIVGQKALEAWGNRVAVFSLKHEETRKTSRSQHDYGFPSQMALDGGISGHKDGKMVWSRNSRQITVGRLEMITGSKVSLVPIEVLEIEHGVREEETYDISVEAHEFVAQGGYLVHNTAEIMFGDPEDEAFMNLKQDKEALMDRRWASNNSVFGRVGMDYSDIVPLMADNGEPGIIWLDNMRNYGRMGRNPDYKDVRAKGSNPCITKDTIIFTSKGPKQAVKLLGTPFEAVVDNINYECNTGVFKTGHKPVYFLKTKEGHSIKVTEDHQILVCPKLTAKKRYEMWVEARDLQPGDKIILNNVRDTDSWDGIGTFEEGWLVGNLLGDGNSHQQAGAVLSYWGDTKHTMLDLALARIETLGGDSRYHKQRKDCEVEERDLVSTTSSRLSEVAHEYGVRADKSIVPDIILYTASSFFQAGFLRGMFDADGSVQGTQQKGVSVRLSAVRIQHLQVVQRMLMNFGINSTIYRNRNQEGLVVLPDGRGGEKEHHTQALYELVISKDNLQVFVDRVGFDEPDRKAKLNGLLDSYSRKPNRERFVATVESFEYLGTEDVYDCTVEEVHRFGANGITIHNCVEQVLENKELCNLVETFPAHHDTFEDYQRTLKFAYLYAKSVTLVPTHHPRTNVVMMRNRRIGCSMSGIIQAMNKLGRREFLNWCDKGYEYISELDTMYSEWLCIPNSIRRSSIKPSGTVSLLPGSTPGIHYPHSEYYIRNIRVANNSPLVTAARMAGYPVEADSYADDTSVVSFPVQEKNYKKDKYGASVWEQFANAVDMQRHWADNAVSITITFKPEEKSQIQTALEHYETQLKSVSLLPLTDHKYVQAPYIKITEAEYHQMMKNVKTLDLSSAVHEKDDKFCDGDTCTLPVFQTEDS